MLKRILVPLDGSALAEQALMYAADLSRPTAASLMLVCAAMSHTLLGVDGRERKSGAIAEAEAYLHRTAAALRERGYPTETLSPYGHPAETIVETARLTDANLIVLTTHGRTGPGRLMFGSVAESVVSNSRVPVLVARAWLPPHRQPFLPDVPALIVPLDGSPLAEAAVEPALALADDLGAGLVLVRVEKPDASTSAAWDYLAAIQARLLEDAPMLDVVTSVREGEPAAAIDAAVLEHNASLVVMATHGRGGPLRSVTGSVAGRVVNQGRAPVVLVRPQRTNTDSNARSVEPIEVQAFWDMEIGPWLDDEERHHGLLKRIEASLRDAIDWTHSPDALPLSNTSERPVTKSLVDTASALIKEEQTGARFLRDLAHRDKGVGAGLQSLLIEMMAMDSDKHARLLQFVHDYLAKRARREERQPT